jgi:hypothetical protein
MAPPGNRPLARALERVQRVSDVRPEPLMVAGGDVDRGSMKLSQFARLGRAIVVVFVVAAPAASAAAGPPEHAKDRAKSAPAKPAAACEERVFSRVFGPWHDRALYTLAPGGDFETQAEGWTLEGPAAIAADSAPFLLGAALGAGSLELPAGATAVSPPICVQRGFPTFRFLARGVSVEPSRLKVQVVYASGKVKNTGRVKPGAEWAPTRKLSLAQGRFGTGRRGTALVRLRFAATAGAVHVDDVYVDPRYNR